VIGKKQTASAKFYETGEEFKILTNYIDKL